MIKSATKGSKASYVMAFAWNFILALLTFGYFMLREQGMFSLSQDYNSQVISFTKLMLDALHGQSGIWSSHIDLGANIVDTMSYYGLGSPFFWLFSWCDGADVLYIMGWQYIVKYAVAGLAAYCYLKRYVQSCRLALAGSVLYAFSGFQTVNLMFSIFHDAVALFPFLLISFEELIENDRRGWFAIVVALNAMTNYYCFVGEVIFLGLYFVIRYVLSDWRCFLKKTGICLAEGVIGAGIACVLLLPSVWNVLRSSRVSDGVIWSQFFSLSRRELLENVFAFLFPSEMSVNRSCFYDTNWASRSAYLPLVGVTFVLAYFMHREKNDWLKRLLAILAILMIFPIGNGIFALFTTNYCRWFYMPILFMVLASVKAAQDWSKYHVYVATALMAVLLLVQYPAFQWWDENKFELILNESGYTRLSLTALAGVGILVVCCFLKSKEGIRNGILLCGISIFAIVTTGYTCDLYQKYDGQTSYDMASEMKAKESLAEMIVIRKP